MKMEERWQLHQTSFFQPVKLTVNNYDNLERAAHRRFKTYQKFLKKTKVSKHADNDKNWNILPDPDKFE